MLSIDYMQPEGWVDIGDSGFHLLQYLPPSHGQTVTVAIWACLGQRSGGYQSDVACCLLCCCSADVLPAL